MEELASGSKVRQSMQPRRDERNLRKSQPQACASAIADAKTDLPRSFCGAGEKKLRATR